eukprot:INCI15763.1.p1 GENE.INCI15763.1~~INCI15763.1.p1  ORF type:complete len:508 (-),score=70.88 INCI15763.1:423-1946(-)
MAAKRTHYAVLGVPDTCSSSDIKQAFRKLAKIHHPDKASEANVMASNASFQEVCAAFTVLREPTSRKQYDSVLQRQRASEDNHADMPVTSNTTPLPHGSGHSAFFRAPGFSAQPLSAMKPPVRFPETVSHPAPRSAQATKTRSLCHAQGQYSARTTAFPSPAFGRTLRYTFSPSAAVPTSQSSTAKPPQKVQGNFSSNEASGESRPTDAARMGTVLPSPPTSVNTPLMDKHPRAGVSSSHKTRVPDASRHMFIVLKGFVLDAQEIGLTFKTSKSTSSDRPADEKEATRTVSQLRESVIRAVSVLTVAVSAKSAEDAAWAYFRDSVLCFSNRANKQLLEPPLRSLLEQRSTASDSSDASCHVNEVENIDPRRASCVETPSQRYRYVLDENIYKASLMQSLASDEDFPTSRGRDDSPCPATDESSLTMLRVWIEQVQVGETLLSPPADTSSTCCGRQPRNTIEQQGLCESNQMTNSPGKRRHSRIASKTCSNAAIDSPMKRRVPFGETQ